MCGVVCVCARPFYLRGGVTTQSVYLTIRVTHNRCTVRSVYPSVSPPLSSAHSGSQSRPIGFRTGNRRVSEPETRSESRRRQDHNTSYGGEKSGPFLLLREVGPRWSVVQPVGTFISFGCTPQETVGVVFVRRRRPNK